MLSQDNSENPNTYFEDVLPNTGWGLYYKFMLGIACACSFSNAWALMSVPYAVPLSTCEFFISKNFLYGLQIIMAMGRITLGNFLNCMIDIYGRKQYISYSLILIFASTFTAAFSYNYYIVLGAAFFLNAGLECNFTCVRVHFAETLPKNKRGFYLSLCDFFWYLGYISVPTVAVFLQNRNVIDRRVVDMRVTTWRLIFAVCGGLNLLLACCAALLEESPRYYLFIKKNFLALTILKQYYAVNKSCYSESFPAKEEDLQYVIDDYNIPHIEISIGYGQQCLLLLEIVKKSLNLLFSRLLLRSTIIVLALRSTLLILGHHELNILLAKTAIQDAYVKEGLDAIFLEPMKHKSLCGTWSENRSIFINFFTLSLNICIGKLAAMIFVDRISRNVNLGLSMMICGICFCLIRWTENNMTRIVLSSLILLTYSNCITVTSIITIESCPTAVRGIIQALTSVLGVIISMILIQCLHYYSQWIYIILGILYIGTSFVAFFIHDLKNIPMIE